MNKSNYGFLALLLRQKLINRWPLMRSVTGAENVLEHSGAVADITLILCLLTNQKEGENIDTEAALAYALLHDAQEVLVSDIPSPVKRHNPAIAKELEKVEKAAQQDLLSTLPPSLVGNLVDYLNPPQKVKDLVKAADIYHAYTKALDECLAGNNKEFGAALNNLSFLILEQCKKVPALTELHEQFSEGFKHSVDALLNEDCPD